MNQSRTVRLPIHIVKEINACLRTQRRLMYQLDREPSAEEVAAALEKSTDDVERLMALHQRVTLRDPDMGEGSAVDRLRAKRDVDPSRRAQQDDVHDIVDRWVCSLGDMQRAVVERRFGLHGCRRSTLEQIGDEVGLTRERVRQIQLDALKNLREMMESSGLSSDTLLD